MAGAVAPGVGIGSLACAILVVNNLRDIPTDTVAGKLTLAVRLGDGRTRWFYVLLVATAAWPWCWWPSPRPGGH